MLLLLGNDESTKVSLKKKDCPKIGQSLSLKLISTKASPQKLALASVG